MEYTMDDVKRMLRKASEIIRSGIAEDATDADREKMDRLLSNDAAVTSMTASRKLRIFLDFIMVRFLRFSLHCCRRVSFHTLEQCRQLVNIHVVTMHQFQNVVVLQVGTLADQFLLSGLKFFDLCGIFRILRIDFFDFGITELSVFWFGGKKHMNQQQMM